MPCVVCLDLELPEDVCIYSKRWSDRNRGFGRSQPISVRGREIDRPASQFLSDRNRDFFRFAMCKV